MADDQKDRFRIVDNEQIGEIYADKFVSIGFNGHVVTIAVGATRIALERMKDPPKSAPVVHITGRLALTPTATVELVNALNNLLTTMGVQKVDPAQALDPQTSH